MGAVFRLGGNVIWWDFTKRIRTETRDEDAAEKAYQVVREITADMHSLRTNDLIEKVWHFSRLTSGAIFEALKECPSDKYGRVIGFSTRIDELEHFDKAADAIQRTWLTGNRAQYLDITDLVVNPLMNLRADIRKANEILIQKISYRVLVIRFNKKHLIPLLKRIFKDLIKDHKKLPTKAAGIIIWYLDRPADCARSSLYNCPNTKPGQTCSSTPCSMQT